MISSSGNASPKGMDQHAHVPALSAILETLSETELRKLMYSLSSTADRELPGNTASPAKLAFEAAALVANHGALNIELLRRLLKLRPLKHLEIQELARAAKISLPITEQDPATLNPPSPKPPTGGKPPGKEESAVRVPPEALGETLRQKGRAALIYAALSAALFITILLVSPERLPSYKLAMVAVISAIMAGFLSMLLTGQMLVRVTGSIRAWHPAVEASGGLAVVVFILTWWPGRALQPDPPAIGAVATEEAKAEARQEPDSTPPIWAETRTPDLLGGAEGAEIETTGSPGVPTPKLHPTVPDGLKKRKPDPLLRWKTKSITDKRLTLDGEPLPPSGLLRLVPPGDARQFVSNVECRIEEAPMTCMLVVKPNNARPIVGDQFELAPKKEP